MESKTKSKFGINWEIMVDAQVIDLTVQSKKYYTTLTGLSYLNKQRSDAFNVYKEGCEELNQRGIRYE